MKMKLFYLLIIFSILLFTSCVKEKVNFIPYLNNQKSDLALDLRTNNQEKKEIIDKSSLINDTEHCRRNNPNGCHNVGIYYYKLKDYNNAIKFHKKGCQLKFALSCFNAGYTYDSMTDYEDKAIYFYKKACQLNYGLGCLNLGHIYMLNKNYTHSLKVYKKACNAMIGLGCRNVAVQYYKGLGTSIQDGSTIMKLLKKACLLGDEASCKQLNEIR